MIDRRAFLAGSAACIACSTAPRETADRRRPLLLTGLGLIDGRGGPVRQGISLLVQGGRIAAIRRDGAHPLLADAEWIDLAGKFATPGLVDMHVHLATQERPAGVMEAILENVLMGGVTRVRDMGGHGPRVAELSRRAPAGLAAPHVHYAALVTGPASDFWLGEGPGRYVAGGGEPGTQPWFAHIAETADLGRIVRAARTHGASALKAHSGFPPALLARLGRAARAGGLALWAHGVVGPALPSDVVRAGADILSHGDMLAFEGLSERPADFWRRPYRERWAEAAALTPADGPAVGRLLAEIARRGVALDPTINVMTAGAPGDPGAHAAYAAAVTRRAAAMGVPILAGTDGIGGSSPNLHLELQRLAAAGLSPAEIIVAATSAAAQALGIGRECGTLEPGKAADIVIYGRDPSADIRNTLTVEAVVKSGVLRRRTAPMRVPGASPSP